MSEPSAEEINCLKLQVTEASKALSSKDVQAFLASVKVKQVNIQLTSDPGSLKDTKDLTYGVRIYHDPILEITAVLNGKGTCHHMAENAILEDLGRFAQDPRLQMAISRPTMFKEIGDAAEALLKNISDAQGK